MFAHHSEFKCRSVQVGTQMLHVLFISSLADEKLIQEAVLHEIQCPPVTRCHVIITPEVLLNALPIKEAYISDELVDISSKLLNGWCYVQFEQLDQGLLLNTAALPHRTLAKAEIETDIFGSQVAFVERLATNLGLIYQLLPDTKLHSEVIQIGTATKTTVSLLYLEGAADAHIVEQLKMRVAELEPLNGVFDSLKLAQLIDDNSSTLFPTILHTERPDRVCKFLLEGKISLLVDGCPFAIVCPVTLYEFLHVNTDMNARRSIGILLRLLRITAMFFSIFGTAFYVAAITFHYQILPPELLKTLIRSHSKVPFPPIFEALLLEIVVELLREAGVRLPTKVGQTMGIVGGIVIGQAAVEAGFVSNVLLMIVALAALASFTIPNFSMSNTQQILRFPFIILAGFWGGIGIVIGISFLTIHLARQTSIGKPYLQPQSILSTRTEEHAKVHPWWSVITRSAASQMVKRNKDFKE
nr:spore germination protein [Paenibacillus taiwanensis]